MKTVAERKLFWYLKNGTELDLENLSHLDMYVQQILTHGKAEDIQKMLSLLTPETFRESFGRIKRFLPKEVRRFWEDGLGDTGENTERHPYSP